MFMFRYRLVISYWWHLLMRSQIFYKLNSNYFVLFNIFIRQIMQIINYIHECCSYCQANKKLSHESYWTYYSRLISISLNTLTIRPREIQNKNKCKSIFFLFLHSYYNNNKIKLNQTGIKYSINYHIAFVIIINILLIIWYIIITLTLVNYKYCGIHNY